MTDDNTKVCPVCGALSFADMPQCFECLHVFGEPFPRPDEQGSGLENNVLDGPSRGMEEPPPAACEGEECAAPLSHEAEGVAGQECASGTFLLEKRSAPDGALEITVKMRLPQDYANFFDKCSLASF